MPRPLVTMQKRLAPFLFELIAASVMLIDRDERIDRRTGGMMHRLRAIGAIFTAGPGLGVYN